MKILRCNRGATLVEFALVALPVMIFIVGIMQTAWVLWVDNLLQISVNTAARCTAVNSTTPPCSGADMVAAANQAFNPLSGATFSANTCTGGTGLVGTYTVTMLWVVSMTVTARSCYPTVPVPS
jgi:Flp pilus assembly protein TadG